MLLALHVQMGQAETMTFKQAQIRNVSHTVCACVLFCGPTDRPTEGPV